MFLPCGASNQIDFASAGSPKLQSRSGVNAARRAGLVYDDPVQLGQGRLQRLPDPLRKPLAGGIFKARNVIEVAMVELLEDRRERLLDVGEVHDPAQLRV